MDLYRDRNNILQALNKLDTEGDLVDYAVRLAEEHFKKLHPKGQFDLFEQPTT